MCKHSRADEGQAGLRAEQAETLLGKKNLTQFEAESRGKIRHTDKNRLDKELRSVHYCKVQLTI